MDLCLVRHSLTTWTAAELSINIGYGVAAGLLFRKGLSGPPPASIQEIDDTHPLESRNDSNPKQTSSAEMTKTKSKSGPERHPITALESYPLPEASKTLSSASGLDQMTDEEKEREAEKLFVLFDRLEKNKILSVSSGKGEQTDSGSFDGGGKQNQGLKGMMQDRLGEMGDRWEIEEAEKERKEREEEDRRDEEVALREVEELRRRRGKS